MPKKGNAKPYEIVKAERDLKRLVKKEGIYNRAKDRGQPGTPLTRIEKKLKADCEKIINEWTIKTFHPRS